MLLSLILLLKPFEEILTNPYELVDQVSYFNFSDAERIVTQLDLKIPEKNKIIAAMTQCLTRIEKDRGHTCAPLPRAIKDIEQIIDSDHEEIMHAVKNSEDKFVCLEADGKEWIATKSAHEREEFIASKVKNLTADINDDNGLQKINIKSLDLPDTIELSDEQETALNEVMHNQIFLITGGPGTGKTTMITAIALALTQTKRDVLLCAPTGRAAKRLEENPGLASFMPKTIHRLLIEIKSGRIKKINTLIIDEASMIDVDLMVMILDALDDESSLILIGDKDQLTPVGAGQVFRDLLATNLIPTASLGINFRQNEGSNIIKLAANVIKGRAPKLSDITKGGDVEFYKELDERKLQELIIDLYLNRLPNMFGYDPINDIQILTPQSTGLVGRRSNTD